MLYQGTCISCVEEEGGAEGSVAEAYHPRAATGRWGPFSGTESKARVPLLFALAGCESHGLLMQSSNPATCSLLAVCRRAETSADPSGSFEVGGGGGEGRFSLMEWGKGGKPGRQE